MVNEVGCSVLTLLNKNSLMNDFATIAMNPYIETKNRPIYIIKEKK